MTLNIELLSLFQNPQSGTQAAANGKGFDLGLGQSPNGHYWQGVPTAFSASGTLANTASEALSAAQFLQLLEASGGANNGQSHSAAILGVDVTPVTSANGANGANGVSAATSPVGGAVNPLFAAGSVPQADSELALAPQLQGKNGLSDALSSNDAQSGEVSTTSQSLSAFENAEYQSTLIAQKDGASGLGNSRAQQPIQPIISPADLGASHPNSTVVNANSSLLNAPESVNVLTLDQDAARSALRNGGQEALVATNSGIVVNVELAAANKAGDAVVRSSLTASTTATQQAASLGFNEITLESEIRAQTPAAITQAEGAIRSVAGGYQPETSDHLPIEWRGTASDPRSVTHEQIRLVPMSGIGSGYLSYVSYLQQLNRPTQLAHAPTALLVPAAPQQVQAPEVDTAAALRAPGVSFNLAVGVGAVTAQRSSAAVEVQHTERHAQSSALTAEIQKRFLLLTPDNDGQTLWYRDFNLSGEDKAGLQQRLNEHQFIQHNSIQRVFVNGSLLWAQEGGKSND